MSHERRQTAVGLLFLFLGVFLILLATAPVIIGLLAKPPVHADVAMVLLYIGIAIAVLGALIIPWSGAGTAVQTVVTIAMPFVPRIGGQRAGDPPAGPPASPPPPGTP